MRAAAGLLLPVWALAAAAGAADEAAAELRRTLLESDDPALIAQREYFPEHYEMVVRLLARIRGDDKLDTAKVRETLGRYSARNWNLYTKRVRRRHPPTGGGCWYCAATCSS